MPRDGGGFVAQAEQRGTRLLLQPGILTNVPPGQRALSQLARALRVIKVPQRAVMRDATYSSDHHHAFNARPLPSALH